MDNAPLLVTTTWLNSHLSENHQVILDCRWKLTDPEYNTKLYRESHIPGAQPIDLHHDLSSPPGQYGGRHPLPDLVQFASVMAIRGVAPNTHVICYDDDGAGAARCWWLLTFYGHTNVSILDGGFGAWQSEGRPTGSGLPSVVSPGSMDSHPNLSLVVDYETLRVAGHALTLVDARAPERFSGAVEPVDRVGGHIPGARNMPFTTAFYDDGHYRSPDELRHMWASLVSPNRPTVVYCGSGVTACVDAFALRLAGFDSILYPGSWSDWIQHDDAPIGRD